MVYDLHILYIYHKDDFSIMHLTIGGAARKRGAGSSSTHEDLKLGEKPAGGIAYLKSVLASSFFFKKASPESENGLEPFLWRPSPKNELFKCTSSGARVTDNDNVHRNSSL